MAIIKQHISSIFAVIIAVVVLFTTSGFSLYSHYCNHQNIENYSILVPAPICEHHDAIEENTSCCKVEIEKSCCETTQQKTENENCCTDNSTYIKLDAKTVFNYTVPQLHVPIIKLLGLYDYNNCQLTLQLNSYLVAYTIEESPPPEETSQFLSKIQVFII